MARKLFQRKKNFWMNNYFEEEWIWDKIVIRGRNNMKMVCIEENMWSDP